MRNRLEIKKSAEADCSSKKPNRKKFYVYKNEMKKKVARNRGRQKKRMAV